MSQTVPRVENPTELQELARRLRVDILEMIFKANSGHPGGSLSAIDLITALYASQEDLEIGDLVFFHELGHVGMYIGNGYVIHAPHTGDVVRIAPLSLPWFQDTYVGATRPGPA